MNWTTTTNTDFKAGDKVKIIDNGFDKEFLDKIFTIKDLSLNKKLCVFEELDFEVFQTKHLKLVNALEIE